ASPVQRSGDRAVLVTGPGLLGRSTAEHPAGYAVLELSDVARVWLRWVGASSQPEPEVLPLGPSPASP
ncbi:MAG: hypothetical protein KDK70_42990, partial [Myxococcales bacterium]|nr:hypothetical protein [Myxococcales bacterium]